MGEELSDKVPLRAIVPNLITSLAACAGITSISLSSEGRFQEALWALLAACICDGIDGRIARLLNASSKLGAELDSLADFVNFGVAPAMFMYFWMTGGPLHIVGYGIPELRGALLTGTPLESLETFSTVGVRLVLACALFYALCDCFRLARFNTMLDQPQLPYWKHFFTGVPAPGGCWMVLTPAILSLALDAKDIAPSMAQYLQNPWTGAVMLLFVGSLMASRLPTISLKKIHFSKRSLLPVMAVLLLLVAFLVTNFWLTIGVLGLVYILSVPVTCLIFAKARAKYSATLANA